MDIGAAPAEASADVPRPLIRPVDFTVSESVPGTSGAGQNRVLVRSGRLVFDSRRLSRVQASCAGQVVSIGQTQPGASDEAARPLRFGDPVKQGQVLAVVWSRELAEKKTDLLSALAEVEVDQQQVARLASARRGSEEDRLRREADGRLQAANMNVARIERTLRSWHVSDEALDELRAEAQRVRQDPRSVRAGHDRQWAEVSLLSPIDGVVLERSAGVGEAVDQQRDLFKICDVDTLGVTIDAYEEDLPALQALAPEARRWTVRLKSEPAMTGIPGSFDRIAHVFDPRSHTIPVLGTIDNSQHQLRAGQFITAEIPLQ